ncbi:MAG: hypothetical protein O7F08_04595, partial [Deltaproteobacteria bacterium]|nr:hypothetical protein [Deltaproteobacteria bacterium]
MNSRLLTSVVLAASLLVFGCGDDGGGGTAGTGGAGATGGSGGTGGGVEPKGCNDIPDTTNDIVPNAPPTS